jgi:hypothetical protein
VKIHGTYTRALTFENLSVRISAFLRTLALIYDRVTIALMRTEFPRTRAFKSLAHSQLPHRGRCVCTSFMLHTVGDC